MKIIFRKAAPPTRLVYPSGAVAEAAGRFQLGTTTTSEFTEQQGESLPMVADRAMPGAGFVISGLESKPG